VIGRSVSNYEIRRLIGEGGMGSVYLAQHPVSGRKAAVKILRRAFAEDEALVAKFIEEAQAVNALRHPHIVDLHEVGRTEEGLPYLLMEYLEGETLRDRLRRQSHLPLADVMTLVAPLASALGAAHGKKIVHADLKPENVFLALDGDGTQRVQVLDFGVARLRGDMGTAVYLAPEQCRSPKVQLDGRTDVYALGTILYEMLCGRPPFQGEGRSDVLMMQRLLQPAPPRSLLPELSRAVEAALLRALSKSPVERFPDMKALVGALEAAAAAPPEPRVVDPATTPAPSGTPTPSPHPAPTPPVEDLQSVQGVIDLPRPPAAAVPVEPVPLPSMTLAPSLAPLAVVTAPSRTWGPQPARLRGRRLAFTLTGGMALLAAVLVWSRPEPGTGTDRAAAPPAAIRPPPPAPPAPTPDPILELPARPAKSPPSGEVVTDATKRTRPAVRPRGRRSPARTTAGANRPSENSWMEKW
jgi:serine/threonine-protein kinase